MSETAKQRREARYRIVRWVDDLPRSDATRDERIRSMEDRLKVEADETNQFTILKGSGDVFARVIQLEHD